METPFFSQMTFIDPQSSANCCELEAMAHLRIHVEFVDLSIKDGGSFQFANIQKAIENGH